MLWLILEHLMFFALIFLGLFLSGLVLPMLKHTSRRQVRWPAMHRARWQTSHPQPLDML